MSQELIAIKNCQSRQVKVVEKLKYLRDILTKE